MALQTSNGVTNQSNTALTTDENNNIENFSYGFVNVMMAAYSSDNQPRRQCNGTDTEINTHINDNLTIATVPTRIMHRRLARRSLPKTSGLRSISTS
jgi:hypothetical protein